jgi:phosphatidylinositol glycan class A protein
MASISIAAFKAEHVRAKVHHAWEQHEAVKAMYCWADVAARVEAVYDKAAATSATALGRLRRYAATGQFSGLLFAAVAVWDALLMRLLEWLVPADSIDICPDLR